MVSTVVAIATFSVYQRFIAQDAGPCTTDFASYYYSALAVAHGHAPYTAFATWIRAYHYVPSGPLDPFTSTSCLHGILESAFTPFFDMLLIPFTWFPFAAALVLWDECQLLLLAGAIYAFLRAAGIRPSWTAMLLLTSAGVVASPARFLLYWGQADVLFLFFICAALWARTAGRPILAGLLLAVPCTSQPALLAVLLFLLWKREFRFAATTLVASAVLILAPFLVLGGGALRDLFTIWGYYAGPAAYVFLNDAPNGILRRLLTPNPYLTPLANAPGLVNPLWILISLAVLAFTLSRLVPHPIASDSRSLLDIGLAFAALLLMSPWSQNNKFVFVLIPLLALYVCARRLGWSTRPRRMLLAGVAIAYALVVLLGDPVQLALANHMGSSLGVLFALLAATYLYPLLAICAVMLYAQRLVGDTTPPMGYSTTPANGAGVAASLDRLRRFATSRAVR
jgi:hypothetical protein